MTESWRRTLDGSALELLADEAGNLFFIEMAPDQQSWALASVAAEGSPRFRVATGADLSEKWGAALGNGVVYLAAQTYLLAFDANDGHLLWQRSFASELTDDLDRYVGGPIAVAPNGDPIVSVVALGRASEQYPNSFVFAVHAADGSDKWKAQVIATSIAVDAAANSYLLDYSNYSIVSLDDQGRPRWTVAQAAPFSDLAVEGNLVFGQQMLSSVDGTPSSSQLNLRDESVESAFVSNGAGFVALVDFSAAPHAGKLAAFSASGNSAPTQADSDEFPSAAILLSDGRLLVQPDSAPNTVRFYSGAQFDSCAMQGDSTRLASAPVLLNGKFVEIADGGKTIVSLSTQLSAAEHGWVTALGNFARNGRAR